MVGVGFVVVADDDIGSIQVMRIFFCLENSLFPQKQQFLDTHFLTRCLLKRYRSRRRSSRRARSLARNALVVVIVAVVVVVVVVLLLFLFRRRLRW